MYGVSPPRDRHAVRIRVHGVCAGQGGEGLAAGGLERFGSGKFVTNGHGGSCGVLGSYPLFGKINVSYCFVKGKTQSYVVRKCAGVLRKEVVGYITVKAIII